MAKMEKLILNIYLKKPAGNILLNTFKRFLYSIMDIEYYRHAFFIIFLLYPHMNSFNNIIINLDIIDINTISIYDNIRKPILLKYYIIPKYNLALISIAALTILCFIESKYYNLMQKVNA